MGRRYNRSAGSNHRRPSGGSGGGRFKLFVMACLVVGPLWMWAYHEEVPIAVTAWQAASVAYETVASFSKEVASDASTAISEEIKSTPDVDTPPSSFSREAASDATTTISEEIRSTPDVEALRATTSRKYAGGSPLNHREIEGWVIEFTNEERTSAGLQPFRHDAAISDIARSHSENMARLGLMSHDIGGRGPTDRALAAGYDCLAYRGDGSYSFGLSENVAEHPRVTEWMGIGMSWSPVGYHHDAKEAARELVQGWMNSPGHRENILDKEAHRLGVGIAIQEVPEYGYVSETIYATQNFSACK